MKYFVVSYNEFRLKEISRKIKELDKTAEVTTAERIDFFFMDVGKIEGPAKIIIDPEYDDFLESDDFEEIGKNLVYDKFNGSTGVIDIYVFDNRLCFLQNLYRYDNLEVRIHRISYYAGIYKNIFNELYKKSWSPKTLAFYDSYFEGFYDSCNRFISSQIFESRIHFYCDHDVADFSFFRTSNVDDVLVIGPDAQNYDFYLECAVKLGYRGRVFLTKHSQLDKVSKLNLCLDVVLIENDNVDYILDNPINSKFEFAKYVKKYLSFLSGASDDLVDEKIDEMLNKFDFSKLPIVIDEIKYVYKVGKNNKGITYYDFSNSNDLLLKIDSKQISNETVLLELAKSEKYVTGIPPVMVERFFNLFPRKDEYIGVKFDEIIEGFCSAASEFPSMYVSNDIMLCYAMFLAALSICK